MGEGAVPGLGVIVADKPTPKAKIVRADYGGDASHGVNLTGKKAGKRVATSKKHPGFAAVQSKIAKKQGVSKERAGAILAASTRKASASAKKANPRLKRVKGK